MSSVPFKSIQYQFTRYIRSRGEQPVETEIVGDIEPRRLKIYRDLFFNNVCGFLDSTFPVCAEILGEQRWRELSEEFFLKHECHTPYFLKISEEFLLFLAKEYSPKADDIPYLKELAHYEWLELAVDVAEVEQPRDFDPNADLSSHVPVLAAATEGAFYQYPVHNASAANSALLPQATALIVYRDRHDTVRFLHTNPFTLGLLVILQDEELTGQDAVIALLNQAGMGLSDTALQGGLQILEQWQEQGLLLGARIDSNSDA
ncbi:putative DNA-binding domain-containing protein [Thalassolituus sp.]|jgi:hypothetical protein|uniref:HvfC family RiPP maturation protein n=1 Tax=Thalassolituus sp. TaxID=2030822 RepID=UPI0032D8D1FB